MVEINEQEASAAQVTEAIVARDLHEREQVQRDIAKLIAHLQASDPTGQSPDIQALIQNLHGLSSHVANGFTPPANAAAKLNALSLKAQEEIGEKETKEFIDEVTAVVAYESAQLSAATRANIYARIGCLKANDIEGYFQTFMDPALPPSANREITQTLMRTYNTNPSLRNMLQETKNQPEGVQKEVYEQVAKTPEFIARLIAQNKGTAFETQLLRLQAVGAFENPKIVPLLQKISAHQIDAQAAGLEINAIISENAKKNQENVGLNRKNASQETQNAVHSCTDKEIADRYAQYLSDPGYKKYINNILFRKSEGKQLSAADAEAYGCFILGKGAQSVTAMEQMCESMKQMVSRYNELELKNKNANGALVKLTSEEVLEKNRLSKFIKTMDGDADGLAFKSLDEKAAYVRQTMLMQNPGSLPKDAQELDRVCLEMAARTYEQGMFLRDIVKMQIVKSEQCSETMLKVVKQQQGPATQQQENETIAKNNSANAANFDGGLQSMTDAVRKGHMTAEKYIEELKECNDTYNSVMKANCPVARTLVPKEVSDRLAQLSDETLIKRGIEIQTRSLNPAKKAQLTQEEQDILHVTTLAKAKGACYSMSIEPEVEKATKDLPFELRVAAMVDALRKSDQFSTLSNDELKNVVTQIYKHKEEYELENAKKQITQPVVTPATTETVTSAVATEPPQTATVTNNVATTSASNKMVAGLNSADLAGLKKLSNPLDVPPVQSGDHNAQVAKGVVQKTATKIATV